MKRGESVDQHEHGTVFQRYDVALQCWKLMQGISLYVFAVRLKKALKQARRQAIQKDLTQISEQADAADILQTIQNHVGTTNLKSLKKPTLTMLHLPDGTPCRTPAQLCHAWIEFFGRMEGGQRMSWNELDETWSLTDLEIEFRRVKKGKAQGQDHIPPEACHVCPTLLAKQYYKALMKLVLHGQESLHHKGGFRISAHKGRGPTTDPAAYRSLLISSHMGKVLQRAPVTLGLHEARAFLRGAQMQGLSV